MTAVLDRLFNPRTVAIIGASTDPKKLGGLPVALSLRHGYAGRLFPVNASAAEVQGLKAYPSLAAIDGSVDCAIIAVPEPAVPDAVRACAAKRVGVAAIFSSGFAEISEAGREAQDRIAAIAREAGVRLVGPNCMGVFSVRSGFVATFTNAFLHHGGKGFPRLGPISIASQSGAVGSHIMVVLRDRGLGLTKWITTGNQCDIEIADCIQHLADDDETEIIVSYIEGCRDGGKLIRALETARARRKPVIMLKVGTSEVGAAAAASHTASLAGSDQVFEAVLRQYGAYRVRGLEDMADVAAAVSGKRYPADRTVGLLTMSGGVGVLMADRASARGLALPELPAGAQSRLRDKVAYAATRNPIDTSAPGMTDMSVMERFLEVMLSEGGFASIVVFLTHLGMSDRWDELKPRFLALRKRYPEPVIVLALGGPDAMRAELEAAGFLVQADPARAVDSVAALAEIGAALSRERNDAGAPSPAAGVPRRKLGEREAKQILARIGLPVADERLARSADEAASAASAVGLPVALKIASADVAHKTEIGGVLLDVGTAAEARSGFAELMRRAAAGAPDARIDGVLVAPMVKDGTETIIGVTSDPVFGPVVMFGIGGIFAEVYRDVAFRLAPFGPDEADSMIREIRGFPLLDGARGRPKADVAALREALVRVSAFATAARDTVASIDLNPFIVRAEGKGAVAVDALIVPNGER
jgi:acyl-CoA synthetase (NDP forming)